MSRFCANCGKELPEGADVCIECGKTVVKENMQSPTVNVNVQTNSTDVSPKSRLAAFLLCTFLGGLGVHRFYVGKVGTGILWLLTCGVFGIGVLIDWIMILCGSFKDNDGKVITDWNA
ncbi:MAG TPA: NINE protein [Bacilli bacterium]|nr:NINE protein [Bacilli bacterium]